MKKALLAALFAMVAASWCLAQDDSADVKPDSVNVTVKVQNANTDAASVTVTTEKGTTDTTVTININRGRRTGKRQLSRRNWVLGCRMASLEFKNFPGTVFLQRRAGRFSFYSMGFRYTSDQIGPNEYHDRNDSIFHKTTGTNWMITVNPEFVLVGERGAWLSTISTGGIYEYGRCRFNSEGKSIYPTFTSSGLQNSCITTLKYGMELSVTIERRFEIGRSAFSAGLSSLLISAISSECSEEEINISTYTSGGTTETTTNQTRSTNKNPVRFNINSPFNGTAIIHLKYWF